jgi:hypothetical protein
MRWLLVAPGDFLRLLGIVAAILGLGMAGDRFAGWVRERRLPPNPLERHLITCSRCSRDAALFPLDGEGHAHYVYSELARLNRSALTRGIASMAAQGLGMPGSVEPSERR